MRVKEEDGAGGIEAAAEAEAGGVQPPRFVAEAISGRMP